MYKDTGFSPGKVTEISAKRIDHATEKRRLRQSSTTWKRRRLLLENAYYSASGQKELREGVTYQSSICLDDIDEAATTLIPSLVQAPTLEKIPEAEISAATLVFDLKTTSLSDNCEIVQISASKLDRTEIFDRYVRKYPINTTKKDEYRRKRRM